MTHSFVLLLSDSCNSRTNLIESFFLFSYLKWLLKDQQISMIFSVWIVKGTVKATHVINVSLDISRKIQFVKSAYASYYSFFILVFDSHELEYQKEMQEPWTRTSHIEKYHLVTHVAQLKMLSWSPAGVVHGSEK